MIRLLLGPGANGDKTNRNGSVDAAKQGGFPLLALWLVSSRGWSPLHFACEARREADVLSILRSDEPHSLGPVGPVVGGDGSGGWTPLRCASAVESELPLALPVSDSLVAMLQ